MPRRETHSTVPAALGKSQTHKGASSAKGAHEWRASCGRCKRRTPCEARRRHYRHLAQPEQCREQLERPRSPAGVSLLFRIPRGPTSPPLLPFGTGATGFKRTRIIRVLARDAGAHDAARVIVLPLRTVDLFLSVTVEQANLCKVVLFLSGSGLQAFQAGVILFYRFVAVIKSCAHFGRSGVIVFSHRTILSWEGTGLLKPAPV